MELNGISDEKLLKGLHAHPQIRSCVADLLAVVQDEAGDLRRADDAEERLIQEMRRIGQEAMQAWANTQVHATEQELRRTSGVHREGKKNCAGTPPSATSSCRSRNTEPRPNESGRFPRARQ